jgi:prepilin-type N-terminal cleavage/methylation domain-containing protein
MRRGLTLIEVLLAIAILGAGMAALLTAASRCLAVMKQARNYQTAQWVLGLGEAAYPPVATNDVEDLVVAGDSSLVQGFTFSREIEQDEEHAMGQDAQADSKEGLYFVRTRVAWAARGRNAQQEEVVSYVLQIGSP